MSRLKLSSAVSAIDQNGALLVFPIKNRREPKSLWGHFFPRSEMLWEWDESGDNRVAELWYLREKISSSGKVVYCKWFQGRATVLSRELYPAFIRLLNPALDPSEALSPQANVLLEALQDNSPLSTKQLKEASGLQGKFLEADYTRRMKELWQKLLIVGVGEIDDGAFPSLAIAASRHYFEEEWQKAFKLSAEEALQISKKLLGEENLFLKYMLKLRNQKRAMG